MVGSDGLPSFHYVVVSVSMLVGLLAGKDKRDGDEYFLSLKVILLICVVFN